VAKYHRVVLLRRRGEIEIRQIFELEDFGQSQAVEHHLRPGEEIGKSSS